MFPPPHTNTHNYPSCTELFISADKHPELELKHKTHLTTFIPADHPPPAARCVCVRGRERDSLGKLTPMHLLSHLVIVAASCIHADNPDHVYLNLGFRIFYHFMALHVASLIKYPLLKLAHKKRNVCLQLVYLKSFCNLMLTS